MSRTSAVPGMASAPLLGGLIRYETLGGLPFRDVDPDPFRPSITAIGNRRMLDDLLEDVMRFVLSIDGPEEEGISAPRLFAMEPDDRLLVALQRQLPLSQVLI